MQFEWTTGVFFYDAYVRSLKKAIGRDLTPAEDAIARIAADMEYKDKEISTITNAVTDLAEQFGHYADGDLSPLRKVEAAIEYIYGLIGDEDEEE